MNIDFTAQLLERIIKLEEQLEAEKKTVRENRKAINEIIRYQNQQSIENKAYDYQGTYQSPFI